MTSVANCCKEGDETKWRLPLPLMEFGIPMYVTALLVRIPWKSCNENVFYYFIFPIKWHLTKIQTYTVVCGYFKIYTVAFQWFWREQNSPLPVTKSTHPLNIYLKAYSDKPLQCSASWKGLKFCSWHEEYIKQSLQRQYVPY